MLAGLVAVEFLSDPLVSLASGGVSCCLASFSCPGGGEGEGGVFGGEVAESGERPPGDNERGVLLVRRQFAYALGGLALAVGAAFAADGAEGGGVAAAF